MPWGRINAFAEAGASEQEIVEAFGLTKATEDPVVLSRLRKIVTEGNARKRLSLRLEIHRRGQRTTRRAGSPNVLALQARALLGWDSQTEQQEPPPDISGSHARLRATLDRLAAKYTSEFGRKVEPIHILLADVYGLDLAKIAGIDIDKLMEFVAGATPPGKVN